jgi:hypothetical protein
MGHGYSEPTLFTDSLHMVLTRCGQKTIIKKKEIFKTKNCKLVRGPAWLSGCREALSPVFVSCVKSLCDLRLTPDFVKICLPESKWCPKQGQSEHASLK